MPNLYFYLQYNTETKINKQFNETETNNTIDVNMNKVKTQSPIELF